LSRQAEQAFITAGGGVERFDGRMPAVDLLVDALFGIGLNRAPAGPAADLITAINAAGVPVLSLDVPSGVDAQTGNVPGVAVRATLTLQFIVRHQGLYTGAALEHVGGRRLAPLEL